MGVAINPIMQLMLSLLGDVVVPTACRKTCRSVGNTYMVDRIKCGDALPSSMTINLESAAGGGSIEFWTCPLG
jgi:hypothetical protein